MPEVLKVKELTKIYPNGCQALKDIILDVKRGEFLTVIGLSGSGKSTLLRCINRLHNPTSGTVHFNGQNITHLKGKALRKVRSKIGMIFQQFNLIPRQTVLANVLMGALSRTGILSSLIALYSKEERERAETFIHIVGLSGKENERSDRLSGGQQQRVAIARTLMQHPSLILADEPVASLDPATSHSVMKYLKKINEELGLTVVCNLHFLSLVRQYSTRVIALKDGEVIYQGHAKDIDNEWFRTIYGEDAVEVSVN